MKDKSSNQIVNMGNLEANIKFLEKTHLLNKEKKILEIGSGKGSLVDYLIKRGYDIIGTEPDDFFIKESKKIFGKLPIRQMSGDDIKFKENSFDIVLSFDVFEHIPNSDKHLQEVRRVLKPNGYYLLQTPNKITNIPWEMMNLKSFNYKKYHCSLHTLNQLKKRFMKNGFKIQIVNIPITNKFTLNKVKNKLGHLGLGLFKLFNPDKMPKYLKTNFYVIARCKK